MTREVLLTDTTIRILVETDNYSVWQAEEADGEVTYHLELGNVTVHLFVEELREVIALLQEVEPRVAG